MCGVSAGSAANAPTREKWTLLRENEAERDSADKSYNNGLVIGQGNESEFKRLNSEAWDSGGVLRRLTAGSRRRCGSRWWLTVVTEGRFLGGRWVRNRAREVQGPDACNAAAGAGAVNEGGQKEGKKVGRGWLNSKATGVRGLMKPGRALFNKKRLALVNPSWRTEVSSGKIGRL
jgi:hypothetical protein